MLVKHVQLISHLCGGGITERFEISTIVDLGSQSVKEHTAVNASVHTGCKQHQRVCTQGFAHEFDCKSGWASCVNGALDFPWILSVGPSQGATFRFVCFDLFNIFLHCATNKGQTFFFFSSFVWFQDDPFWVLRDPLYFLLWTNSSALSFGQWLPTWSSEVMKRISKRLLFCHRRFPVKKLLGARAARNGHRFARNKRHWSLENLSKKTKIPAGNE